MRTLRYRAGVVVTATVIGIGGGVVAPAAAGPPPAGSAVYKFQRYECVQNSNNQFVAVGKAKTTVNYTPEAGKKYYQKVTIKIDKLVLGGDWRQMEKRTYSWEVFTNKDVPEWSVSGVKTVVGATIANGGTMSVKLEVKLKRVRTGPDATAWSYEARSPSFSCSGEF